MQLDENTYESHFLSYIDNELNAAEQKLVVQFIADHPKYASALEELKAAKLIPEEIIFEAKAHLYQLSDADTECIQYLDQEMSATARLHFELKCRQEPSLANSLSTWQKTYINKLNPVIESEQLAISFKNRLYHSEKETALLINPFQWKLKKYAFASMAALCFLFIGYRFYNQNLIPTLYQSSITEKGIPLPIDNSMQDNREPTLEPKPMKKYLVVHPIRNKKENDSDNRIAVLTTKVAANNTKDAIDNEKSHATSFVTQEVLKAKIAPSAVNTPTLTSPSATALLELNIAKDILMEAPPTIETPLIEYETIPNNESESSIYIGNFEIDESKIRGITRKINVLFKRNKNRDK